MWNWQVYQSQPHGRIGGDFAGALHQVGIAPAPLLARPNSRMNARKVTQQRCRQQLQTSPLDQGAAQGQRLRWLLNTGSQPSCRPVALRQTLVQNPPIGMKPPGQSGVET